MKRYRKRNYGYYFIRHLGFMIIAWLLIMYLFLQAIFLFLYSRIDQKSSVNFYEGMEQIQYLVKNNSLMDVEGEVMMALGQMSYAGSILSENYENGGVGSLFGIRLGALTWLFENPSYGHDGYGNTLLDGLGIGYGFLMDAENDEILLEARDADDYYQMYLVDNLRREEFGYSHQKSLVVNYETQNTLLCNKAEMRALQEELIQTRKKWIKYFQDTGMDMTGKRFRWEIDEFYIKGDRFFPAKTSLYIYTVVNGFQRDKEFCETVVSRPGDLDGYELYKIDKEKEWASALFLGYLREEDESALDFWKPDEAFRQKALAEIETNRAGSYNRDAGAGRLVGNPLSYFLNGEMIFVRSAYFFDAKGHQYKICTYQTISRLFLGNLEYVSWWGFWLLYFLFVLTFFTAYVHHLKNRHTFMTKAYREMLMDSMAHDLKSPLMAIGGYAENLKDHMNDEKRDHYADEIQKSVGYMNDVVMKNLELLKFDKEHKKLVRKSVNVREVFEEAFGRYQVLLDEKKQKLSIEGELTAKGDEELLKKVAENLVTNCVRYTTEGGNIVLKLEKHGFTLENDTQIEYQGSLKRLWEPFVRGEDSRTGRGTGLGLAIVAHILDRHSWKYKLVYDKVKKTFACVVKIPCGILF